EPSPFHIRGRNSSGGERQVRPPGPRRDLPSPRRGRILSMQTHSHRLNGHDVHEHTLSVPLDHTGGTGGTIEIFAREIVRDGVSDRPRLVWFQGGPGNRANRPT